VTESFEITLAHGPATAVEVERMDDLPDAARALGLTDVSSSLVLVGGADGMSAHDLRRCAPLFQPLVELASRFQSAAFDGGTDTGVMRLMGRALATSKRPFPLVGVVCSALAAVPGRPPRKGAAELEPNHTDFALVPGEEWGDEAPWLARLAETVGERTATVLVNGGDISMRDAVLAVEAGRPLIVVDGSGRTADALAAAARGKPPNETAERIAATGLVRPVPLHHRNELAWALEDVLAGRT
jgi:hypothetical protein